MVRLAFTSMTQKMIYEVITLSKALLTILLTIMRRIVMNWAILYVMISECYLIDDGCLET